jgi:hypothetical protein
MRRFALALLLLAALSGCATTRLEVTTPEGLRVRASFPKDLAAEGLRLEVAGHTLRADKLRTSASRVIGAQGAALSDTVQAAASLR